MQFSKLCFAIFAVFILTSANHYTKPTDVVGVTSFQLIDGAIEKNRKTYTKPWNQIKIDKQSIQVINSRISNLQEGHGLFRGEKFRIQHLYIINNNVERVLLVSDHGSAVAMMIMGIDQCAITVETNNRLGPYDCN